MDIVGNVAGEIQQWDKPISLEQLPETRWVSREKAALHLGKSLKTVDRLRKRGILRDHPHLGFVRISRESLEEYLRRPINRLDTDVQMIMVPAALYNDMIIRLRDCQQIVADYQSLERRCTELKQRCTELECAVVESGNDGWWNRLTKG